MKGISAPWYRCVAGQRACCQQDGERRVRIRQRAMCRRGRVINNFDEGRELM